MKKTQVVECEIVGFEGVKIEFNMMAASDDWDAWMRSLGTTEEYDQVVVAVQGWDDAQFGPAFGKRTPMAFLLWATKRAVSQAFQAYANDPN